MNEIKERQHISDAAWERREFKTHSRKTCEKMRRAEGTMLVTVEEWDALVAKLAERDAEIARLKADHAHYELCVIGKINELNQFWDKATQLADYWLDKYSDLKGKEVVPNGQQRTASLTMLPQMDHRLGRGNG